MNQFKSAFIRFMQGRYGPDQLNNGLLYFALLLTLINSFWLRNAFVTIFCYLLLVIMVWRMFSRKTFQRQKENRQYMDFTRPVRSRCQIIIKNIKDKEHRYYACPHCYQLVRVPKGRGKIEITCPRCHSEFERKS